MSVIGAGFPRTGTLSLKTALEELGCGPCYHFLTLFEHPEHVDVWQAAEDGQDVEWDSILGDFNSAVDWPPSVYYEQLMQAYPDAKVVLTKRDPERWYESFSNTILWVNLQQPLPPMVKMHRVIWSYMDRIFEGGIQDRQRAIAGFERWNREVRERVPSDRLLVFEVQQGWEPLCRFLDIPVPEGKPFPHVNDTEAFQQRVFNMRPSPQRV
jgi:hypothetical protein